MKFFKQLIFKILCIKKIFLKCEKERIKSSALLENYFLRISKVHKKLKKKVDKNLNENREIVFGPFYSEVGFEILYWYPFINSLISGIDKKNIKILSRGGLSKLFFKNCESKCLINLMGRNKYLEFIKKITNNYTLGLNQKSKDLHEDDILQNYLNIKKNTQIIKPYNMFKYYKPFFSKKIGEKFLNDFNNYDIYTSLYKNLISTSQRKYDVTIKIYNSNNLNLTEQMTSKLINKINELKNKNVCILYSNDFDDHTQLNIDDIEKNTKVIKVPDNDNLLFQGQIIADSKVFITTYGGMSYLGPILGTNTIGLVNEDKKWSSMSHPHFFKFLSLLKHINFRGSFEVKTLEEFTNQSFKS